MELSETQQPDRLWTRAETARYLSVSLPTLDRMPIPRVRHGRVVRFAPDTVRRWVLAQCAASGLE